MIWVQKARSDHADFVLKMKDRGVEVLDIQDLLTDIFRDSPEARAFVLDRRITDNQVGPMLARILRPGSTSSTRICWRGTCSAAWSAKTCPGR